MPRFFAGYIILILVILHVVTALDCYVGRQFMGAMANGGSFTKVGCPIGTSFCVKRHFSIQYNEDIIEKTCDQNSQCYNTGSGCYYDPNNNAEFCCCDSNGCNGASTIGRNILFTVLSLASFLYITFL